MRSLVISMGLMTACGVSTVQTRDGGVDLGDNSTCTLGERVSCVCANRTKGKRTCDATGHDFGPCQECPTVAPQDMAGVACGDCDGCCDGTTCIPFASQDQQKCGGRGTSCQDCGAGFGCVVGECLAVTPGGCMPANCANGCCTSGVCVAPTSQSAGACGAAGAPCIACTGGAACQSGSCSGSSLDDNTNFYVRVKSLSVKDQTPSGYNWDPFGTPDPYVYIVAKNGSLVGQQRTSCSDVTVCSPAATSGDLVDDPYFATPSLITIKGADLKAGITVQVWDDDGNNGSLDDEIGEKTMFMITAPANSYKTGPFGSVLEVELEIY